MNRSYWPWEIIINWKKYQNRLRRTKQSTPQDSGRACFHSSSHVTASWSQKLLKTLLHASTPMTFEDLVISWNTQFNSFQVSSHQSNLFDNITQSLQHYNPLSICLPSVGNRQWTNSIIRGDVSLLWKLPPGRDEKKYMKNIFHFKILLVVLEWLVPYCCWCYLIYG